MYEGADLEACLAVHVYLMWQAKVLTNQSINVVDVNYVGSEGSGSPAHSVHGDRRGSAWQTT